MKVQNVGGGGISHILLIDNTRDLVAVGTFLI